ncbi:unnamed protein product [Dicrocoelium dendriticum]|nr:unnamed protein product [Dicrocoelium dendriticum]
MLLRLRVARISLIFSFPFRVVYYFVMRCLSETVVQTSPNIHRPFTLWDLVLWLGILSITTIGLHTYYTWYAYGTWSGHPTVRSLKSMVRDSAGPSFHHSSQERWRALVSSINAECRRPDKFVASHGSLSGSWPGRRLIATDSWILSSHGIKFQILRQASDRMLAVVVSTSSIWDAGSLTEGGRPAGENLGTQTMAVVRFVAVDSGACLLTFSLRASDLDSLRAKLQFPMVHAEGVELEPTIVQRFIRAFCDVVEENGTVSPPQHMEIEQCIGCMSSRANVMLQQRCDSAAHAALDAQTPTSTYVPPCSACHCRPMWCLECMARWFAARQTESHRPTSVWLSGRIPCPTCRNIFCVRDVVRIAPESSSAGDTM